MLAFIALVTVVFLLVAFMMSVGVLISNKPIKGSCGGISSFTGDACSMCGKDLTKKNKEEAIANKSYKI